jgi:iron complex transport system permease protein
VINQTANVGSRFVLKSAWLALCLLACISLFVGAAELSVFDVLSLVSGRFQEASQTTLILFELRLPRTLLAMFAGASLSVGGVMMQTLFRNPLAEPGLVGVSAGASMGAVLALWLGFNGFYSTSASACLGALGASWLAWWVAQRNPMPAQLLLAGIAINALVISLVSLLMSLSDDQTLRSIVFWSLGSLARAQLEPVLGVGVWVLVVLIGLQRQSKALNALLLGTRQARHVGLNVDRFRTQLLIVTALLVAPVVALTGVISFVGLVVPNLLRMRMGTDHRGLLPAAACFGAMAVLLADLLCRVAVQPAELPVGVVTSLLGAPFFIYLLWRRNEQSNI